MVSSPETISMGAGSLVKELYLREGGVSLVESELLIPALRHCQHSPTTSHPTIPALTRTID